jgi:Rieske Fe-S protein
LALLGFSRRLWAQRPRLRYLSLSRPVVIPLANLDTPGRARRFVAQGVSPASAANPNQPVRVNGMVVRIAAGAGRPDRDQFKAVCAVCPHEQCEVDFVADPGQLDPLVVAEIGGVDDPVYLCPCHNSVFTMDEGRRLGGPAPRGLYRFRVTDVTDSAVVIGEVEEDVLIFF